MRKLHSVIPAAGFSKRMGQPKLLMTIDGETLIERLIRQLNRSEITSINVLVRADDDLLREAVEKSNATAIIADGTPPEMLDSVKQLVKNLIEIRNPNATDGWLLIPADHPIVEANVLAQLLEAWKTHPEKILVPTNSGKRGHPTIFPWSFAHQLDQIPPNHGLNWLVRQSNQVLEVEVSEASILLDVDTPNDFEKLKDQLEEKTVKSRDVPKK